MLASAPRIHQRKRPNSMNFMKSPVQFGSTPTPHWLRLYNIPNFIAFQDFTFVYF